MEYRLEVGLIVEGHFESAVAAVEYARERYQYNNWRVVDEETGAVVWFNEPSTQLVEQMLGEQTRFDRTERVSRHLSEQRTQRALDQVAERQRADQRRRRIRLDKEEKILETLNWKEYGF